MLLGTIGSIITSLLTAVPEYGPSSSSTLLLETLLASNTLLSPSPTQSPLQIRQTHLKIISIGNTSSSRLPFLFLACFPFSLRSR